VGIPARYVGTLRVRRAAWCGGGGAARRRAGRAHDVVDLYGVEVLVVGLPGARVAGGLRGPADLDGGDLALAVLLEARLPPTARVSPTRLRLGGWEWAGVGEGSSRWNWGLGGWGEGGGCGPCRPFRRAR
jgi:hypothetical protein